MLLQIIGIVASVITIAGFFWWLGARVYRFALQPRGSAIVLTGMSIVTILTFAGVLLLLAIR
jgi:hypothetical protein